MYTNTNNNVSLSEEQVVTFLKNAVARVEGSSESDIQSFNVIKGIFKKNVSLFRRNDVAAYLVKEAMLAGSGRGSRFNRDKDFERRNEKSERGERTERTGRFSHERPARFERPASRADGRPAENAAAEHGERTERPPRVQIDPAVASTIFVSIGRNRRVYPRDLVGLLVSVAGLGRERIGDIRVLANYSFVQLFSEDCEKVIAALNDYDYRGRKLSVSYSKQVGKEEEAAPAAPAAAEESKAPEAQAEAAPEQPVQASVPETAPEKPVAEQQPYSETTDDGQVKSHFGNGAAY